MRDRETASIIPRMDFAKHGSLVAALLYVVAVGTLLAGQSPVVPQPVLNSLELRPLLLLGRMIEPPEAPAAGPAEADPPASPWVPAGEGVLPGRSDPQAGEWEELSLMLRAGLESVAHRPLATREDPLRAAAVAAGLGARHLVPPYAGPLAAEDPAAAALVRWAFDPASPASDADLAALRDAGLPPPLGDMAVAAVAQAAGRTDDAATARAGWIAAADEVRQWASLATIVFAAALVVGTVLWFRMRRLQWEAMAALRLRPTVDSLLPVARVLAYFMAVYLTVGVFGPDLLAGLEIPGGVAGMATLLYLVNAVAGIALVLATGRSAAGEPAADLLGLRTMGPSRAPAGAAWGVAGWCMLVPAVLSATFFAATVLGIGGNPFDNPVAMLLAMDPSPDVVALLLFSTVVLAPLFEEMLFRGFLHGRLRRHFTPYGAAALSGLLFAIAHLSVSNLLPLWALGFALGILYDRTRTLWAPMVAHALWNLGTAGVLLTLFS